MEKISRTAALFWAVFLVAGIIGLLVSQNIHLRRQVRDLEAAKPIQITNSVHLNPLQIKAMMEEVLASASFKASAAGQDSPRMRDESRVKESCDYKERQALEAARALKMRPTSARTHYNAVMDKCMVDLRAAYTDPRGRNWNIRVIYDANSNSRYGEMTTLEGALFPDYCAEYPHGDQRTIRRCTSVDAFSRLVAPYMGYQ